MRLVSTCIRNLQTRIHTFHPQAATRNTAAEIFRIDWLSVSGEYAQILIHLSLWQQSNQASFEDDVNNTQAVVTPTSREQITKKGIFVSLQAKARTIKCLLTFHPELPKVKEIVNKHFSITESSKHLKSDFPSTAHNGIQKTDQNV